ncbi:aminopeptidase N [Parashewanella spongiae]|uniref:Aminopeptidase N n=2 Tax=Parashewanella spongiae TaxID=342950 RepID=A0A3A6U5F4_9GAMM|nr:aminopeptidase N [Parashewanella spongiae]
MLAACSHQPLDIQKPVQQHDVYLTQQQAELRSTQVSGVSYQLHFELDGSESFSATSVVNFTFNGGNQPLRLDLNKAKIHQVLVNGTRLYPNYNDQYILFSSRLLIRGENRIQVDFTRKHSTNGEGLHRFVDPVDAKVYLYSHFEPAAAQQMFALFDQPDLKANFELTVSAPKDWQVISSMREDSISTQDDNQLWHFPTTPKLSPYNFSMHAGPYHVWRDNSGKYPMRLLARQSVAKQVTPNDWFRYTDKGLRFFDDYFGISYPFKKYDQLLVPDFLYGAMENAAAITFAEGRFLHKSTMTPAQKQRLAGVIMHEMAHQWFGNLVTMKWWNGLWLNESFASFMGTLATAEATEFTNAWRSFYSSSKQSAYALDSKVTTHPIEVPVSSTANAFDNIDAITYSKGAATLYQLQHLLGKKTFRNGVSQYLTKYSYQNAELADFINSLALSANRDLTQWTDQWLYQAGVNTISVDYRCQSNKISHFQLLQAPASKILPTLREQKVLISLFKKEQGELFQLTQKPVIYKGKSTPVPSLIGQKCPDLIYPNTDDLGYVKVNLDKRSFETAKNDLLLIHDPLLRSMLWQSLWDSVQDGKLGLDKYLGVVLVNAPKEKDYTILRQVISSLYQSRYYLSAMTPEHEKYANMALKAMAQLSIRMTMEFSHDPVRQKLWFNTYINFASHPDALKHLYSLLFGESYLAGITSASQPLDQDTRWNIIYQLNRYDFPNSKVLITLERQRDQSDSGQKSAIAAEAVRPEAEIKRKWLSRIYANTVPFSKLRTAMNNLYPSEQKLLSDATAEERLMKLVELDKLGSVYMRSFAAQLTPKSCDQANIRALEHTLESQPQLSHLTKRILAETKQVQQRCILVKETMKG